MINGFKILCAYHPVALFFLMVAIIGWSGVAYGQPAIANPGFEANGGAFQVATGWTAFGTGKFEGAQYTGHGWCQGVADFPPSGSLGVYQRLSGAIAGANYRLTVEVKSNHSMLIGTIGIDPSGGTNPSNATWGSTSNSTNWTQVSVTGVATTSTITVFLRGTSNDPNQIRFDFVLFDNVTIASIDTPTPSLTPTPTRTATRTVTPGGPTMTPSNTPVENPTPFIPSGPVWGSVLVLGESIQAPGWRHDDLGPPMERIVQVYGHSASTCLSVGFTDWGRMEPQDPGAGPSTYDWTLLEYSVDPFRPILPGRLGIAYASFDTPAWLSGQYGTTRYWQLAERFMEAFARQMNRRGIYHFIFENEPNLLVRSDWADYYMDRLRHAHTAIKRADARNQIIGGNLAERAAASGHFNILFDRGLLNYCDVVGSHPYSNDPLTGVDLSDVILLRQQMVARGAGNKKIFLGEGWGPKRVVPGIDRQWAADRPNRAEIDRLRDFMLNGYQRLATPRADYDPNWLLGALFFTFNDNLGALHWADRATPVPNGCLIDGYLISPCDTSPRHHNGGLVDLYGNAKRDLIWRFPNGVGVPSPTPPPLPSRIGGNLLQNGNFEGGFTGGVANGWQRFDTTLTGRWESRAGRTGGSCQAFGETSRGFNGGIRQVIPTTPGAWYGISAWVSWEESGTGPGTFMALGWDTTGQTQNPRAMSMVWSMDYADIGFGPNTWYYVEQVFQAQANQASIWFWGGVEWSPPTWFMRVDDVSVTQVADPRATPTPSPSATPLPPDSDDDGIPDVLESGNPGPGQTNRWLPDSDGDGLRDGVEDSNRNGMRDAGETSARNADTDGDAFEDGIEVRLLSSNPLDNTSPSSGYADSDADSVPDIFDQAPLNPDGDNDRFRDGYEVAVLSHAAAYDANVRPRLGDLNGDLQISNLDGLVVHALFLQLASPATTAIEFSDGNRDGLITNVDALVLQSFFLLLLARLPL